MPRAPSRLHDSDALERGSTEHYLDAAYYDVTYRSRRADVEFYRRLARQHGGPILEIGGGTGRVTLPLVRDGHDVTSLDASSAMLEQASARATRLLDARARRRVRFLHADMREFALRRRFPLVIAPFNVLLHLYEPDDFRRCFRTVASHLRPNGRFVFDVRVPDLGELQRDPSRAYTARGFRHPTLGYPVRYIEHFAYDPIKQVQSVRIRFIPGPGAPREAREHETLLTQRQIFPNELRGLLALGGLKLAARHGSFTGRPLAAGDLLEIVTAVAARPSR